MFVKYDEPTWLGFLAGFVSCIVIAGLLVTAIITLTIHSDHVSCLRLHEQTNLATKYARSGANGECYVQLPDGTWTPEDRWINIKEAS